MIAGSWPIGASSSARTPPGPAGRRSACGLHAECAKLRWQPVSPTRAIPCTDFFCVPWFQLVENNLLTQPKELCMYEHVTRSKNMRRCCLQHCIESRLTPPAAPAASRRYVCLLHASGADSFSTVDLQIEFDPSIRQTCIIELVRRATSARQSVSQRARLGYRGYHVDLHHSFYG